jgi:porin
MGHVFAILNSWERVRPHGCAIAFTILILAAITGRAQDGFLTEKALEGAPTNLEDEIEALGNKGALFKFNYWGEDFGNFSGGYKRGDDYEGLFKIELTLDLQKLVHWDGATVYGSMLYLNGEGISGRYVHDYNLLSNIDAYDSVRLFELWFRQTLFDGKISIWVGQLTTDNNFCVSNNSALFINSAYGAIGPMLHNIATPIYPVGSEGVRLQYNFNPSFYVQALAVDDNPGFQNYDDKYGTQFGPNRSHGVLAFYEAGYIPDPSSGSSPFGAGYKLGGYYDSQFHPDISNGTSGHGDYGFYAVVDQPLYIVPGSRRDSPQGLSGFARISYVPDQRNPVVYYFDTGFNYTGIVPGRSKDIFGAAFTFERLGTDVYLASGAPVLSHHENVLEITYLANLTEWFSLQPDFQYIFNPGGFGRTPNAAVAGIRFNVTF